MEQEKDENIRIEIKNENPFDFTRVLENMREEKKALISLMYVKIKTEDWHAVADCANDIREIDAVLNFVNGMSIL